MYKIGKKTNDVCLLAADQCESALTWHRRLGHMNLQTLQRIRSNIAGIDFSREERLVRECMICATAKSTRLPFPSSKTNSKKILEIVHSDIMGPMETASISGKRYCLTFIDHYSRKVCVRFLRQKNEALDEFKAFRTMIEKQTDCQITVLRSDNGGEYCSEAFDKYCRDNGIQHQKTTPYTPEQNGVSERMNRTLKEKAKCMLFDAQVPKSFWAEAVNMAAYIINHSVNSVLKSKTPDEVFHDKEIDISKLKIFGSSVAVHIPKQRRRKWDANAQKMIFVGYDNDTKAYRCIDPNIRKLVISRDVRFFEDTNSVNVDIDSESDNEAEECEESDASAVDDLNEFFEIANTPDATLVESESEIENASPVNQTVRNVNQTVRDVNQTVHDESSVERDDERNDPDFQTRAQIQSTSTPRAQSRARRPVERYQPTWLAFLAEPETVEQANNSSNANDWKKAMSAEMSSHEVNNTWTLTELPRGRKAIKSRWVFKLKENANEKRFKARLVAKGFSQKYGID